MISDNSNNSTLAVNNDNADNNTTATTLFDRGIGITQFNPKQLRIGKQQRKLITPSSRLPISHLQN